MATETNGERVEELCLIIFNIMWSHLGVIWVCPSWGHFVGIWPKVHHPKYEVPVPPYGGDMNFLSFDPFFSAQITIWLYRTFLVK